MNTRTKITIALAGVSVLGGCLVDNLCVSAPDRAECHLSPTEGSLLLLSPRVPLQGGELAVRVEGVPVTVEALLSPRGLGEKRVPLQRGLDGVWRTLVKPQELWPTIVPGPLPVRLITPSQTHDTTLRLFVPPVFGPDVSRSARVVWLSVVNRHVVTLEQGATDRTFGDWTYQAPLLNRTGSVPAALAFTVPPTGLFAMTESVFLRLIPNGSAWQLQQSPLGELRYSDVESGLDYASVTALAVGKHGPGNLLAVAAEGGTGPALRGYRFPDGGTLPAQRLMIPTMTGPVGVMAVGPLDDNSDVDLVTIGKDGVPSVWLASASTLERDSVASQSLAAQLGSEPVRSLAVADLDRDGLADVIVSRKSQLQWLANQSDRTFAAPVVLVDLPDNVSALDVGLVDGNESPDLAVGLLGVTLISYLNQAP